MSSRPNNRLSAGKYSPSLKPQSRVSSLSDHNFRKGFRKPLSLSHPYIFSVLFFVIWNQWRDFNERQRTKVGPPRPPELQEAEANPHCRGGARVEARVRSLLRRRKAPRMVAHILSRKSICNHQFHPHFHYFGWLCFYLFQFALYHQLFHIHYRFVWNYKCFSNKIIR